MSTSQHTPGHISQAEYDRLSSPTSFVSFASFASFAGSSTVWIDARAETLTEARQLHATYYAAPNLLAALKQCQQIVTENPSLWGDPLAEKFDTIARDAIAKAEGKQ